MDPDIYKRHEGLLDTEALLGKSVALVGLGSVGSAAASWLCKSGVGQFRLLDPDELSMVNICRHACGTSDVGRYKTQAVRDLILDRNPDAAVSCFQQDVVELTDGERKEVFKGCDLIVASTDSVLAQHTVNLISLSLNIPALYIGCYERAGGGEIVYVIPGETPCFNCAFASRAKNLKPMKGKKTALAYTMQLSESQADRMQAEPGLAVDIDLVTVSAMPYALALLDPGSNRRFLLDRDANIIFISTGNKPTWIFTKPFSRIIGRPDEGCSICRPPDAAGPSEEEALCALEIEKGS